MAPSDSGSASLLKRITDPDTLQTLLVSVDAIVDLPARFRTDALEGRQWVAVPMESANHIDEGVASRVVDACRRNKVRSLYAVETEEHVTERCCYSLPATVGGLASFNRMLGLMYCVLVPPTTDWLILCTRDEHYAVAGTMELVESVIGKSAGRALEEFREFASHPDWDRKQREFYLGVVERYQEILSTRLRVER